ncbi:uncharacterized protein [Hetaerina americana]|uniref:uncharacterized protein isoform X3 n=1 Tax=Hetaerina americana TaxID=62018 RepID=UPI003A7F553F
MFWVLQPTANDFIPIFDFKRYWIAVEQKVPTENLGVDPNHIINKLEKDDFYTLAVDINLSPNLEATDPITPFISQVAWSCKGMVNYGRCIFATLTNTGLVCLYYLRNSKWIICLEFSRPLREFLEGCWEKEPRDLCLLSAPKQLNYLKRRALQMKTTVIGWSQTFSGANSVFSYFLMGQANGDIIIWKLPVLSVKESKIVPKFIMTFKSKLVRLTCLSWHTLSGSKGILTAGDHCGIIRLFNLQLNPMNTVELELVNEVDIWPDPDNIPVKMLKCLGDGSNLSDRCITAVKGNFFVLMSLNDDGTVAHRTSLHVGKFSITGCEIVNNSTIVLASQNGCMTRVDINKEENKEINVDVKELTSSIDLSDKICHGFGASHNKMIWIMVNSIYKPFDHLILRYPTTAVLFTLGFIPDPLSILKKNPTLCLTNYWDCFETLRILVARGKYSTAEVNTENLLSQSIYQLCCSLWTFQIISKYRSQGSELTDEMNKTIRRLEDAIFAHHAYSVLQKLSSSDLKCLSESHLQSFGLFYKWMQKFVSECEDNAEHIKSLLNLISNQDGFSLLPLKEMCSLCGENVEMKHWKNAQCDADVSHQEGSCQGTGHCMPRCSISLIQCSVPYRICNVCSALANQNLVHMDNPVCIFCHGNLNLDDRVLLQET